tara:strand:- start:526 stop:753 length:228 start_codon:yes stop_codon:yes gene_type:complete
MKALTSGMFILLFNSPVAHASPDSDELKKDMKALELFLQDKEDYKEYCSYIKWEQPDISVYKKELKSQLPENCKK